MPIRDLEYLLKIQPRKVAILPSIGFKKTSLQYKSNTLQCKNVLFLDVENVKEISAILMLIDGT